MTWVGVWAFLKEVPSKVWLGVAWALCILGWWLTRSELAKEKAKIIRLEHRAKNEVIRKEAIVRLQERKARIQEELTRVKKQVDERDTQIHDLNASDLARELNDEFTDS